MSEPQKTEPHLNPAATRARAEREARQAEALRANLHRRKQQARGRDAQQAGSENPPYSVYPNISDKV